MNRGALRWMSIGMVVSMLASIAWPQTDNGQTTQTVGTTPDIQSNPPQEMPQNPPLSGLDQPSLGPSFPTRSFFVPGAHVSEALDTNVGQGAGTSAINGVTRVLGSLMLQKIGEHSVTALDYVGGAAFYTGVSPANH